MKYYDLSPTDRKNYREEIKQHILESISAEHSVIMELFDHYDTHTRKVVYTEYGKLYLAHPSLREGLLKFLHSQHKHPSEKVRQTIVYAAGEIACIDFARVERLLENSLNDKHHSVRNAVTGALKTACNKNPCAIDFCRIHIQSTVPENRRLVCHGLELRGRTHPQEILPLLKTLQHDPNRRVQEMLVHVLGQISYKEGCFYFVCEEVRSWDNKELFECFKEEAIEVHKRYSKFSELTVKEVSTYFM